jgi:uncharacterized protein HemX
VGVVSENDERLPRGPKGEKGEQGAQGEQGRPSPRLPVSQARAIVYLFLLAVVLSATALFWINHQVRTTEAAQQRQAQAQQRSQRQAGLLIEKAICTDMGTMAQIPPPTGNAASNPSRAYEQDEHRAWAGLYAGLGCRKIP